MNTENPVHQPPIAIIGMGGMFAQSRNIKDFWRVLRNGIDCITDPPPTHQGLRECFDSDPNRPDHIYCNRGGFLPTVSFDPTEFGIPPAVLEATDTSQLLGLVAAKTALSDAGYGDQREFDRDHTSVILGVTGTQELVIGLGSRLGHPVWRKALDQIGLSEQQKSIVVDYISNSYVPWQENSFPGLLGNVVAGRISNRLNLGGTNCVVDAACASSLSALHLGLMELTSGRSNLVVTGGVDTINDPFMHMCFAKTGVLSPSGDARPFSADSDGTVLGEGIGILVLKRLEEAERDGDRIYAVIRGIGSSSDGKSQSIYAPRANGQARALIEAYRNTGFGPETVELLEAHGTGTRVGDEVEFNALKRVFDTPTPLRRRCALGSVKSMIGHTKAAAGVAGVIKSALSLYHKVLPPTLKVAQPDSRLDIENSPFYLNTTTRPWFSPSGSPRRSGVSAFGFGGSNFHVVLEEYRKERMEIAWDGSVEILAFSGTHPEALAAAISELMEQLVHDGGLSRIGWRARSLRAAFASEHPQRLVMVVDTALDPGRLNERLQSAIEVVTAGRSKLWSAQGIYYGAASGDPGKTAFLFPGQGSQYAHMGRDLACSFPDFMQTVECAADRFDSATPLWDYLYPQPGFSEDQLRRQTEDLRRTEVAQLAIGAVSLGMLSVLDYFHVRPDATCGHSYGELPALCAAGWIDRETLWQLSVTRGRLMADAAKNGDAGGMLAVQAAIPDLQALAGKIPDLVLANINSPNQGVLSGTNQALERARRMCAEAEYRSVDLPVAAAFHSPLVASAGEPFAQVIAKTPFTPTPIPVYANVTAMAYPTDPAGCRALLSRQLTAPVAFQQTLEQLYAAGVRTFVEVGPKAVLSGMVRSTLNGKPVSAIALDRSAGKASGIMDLAHAISHLAALGSDLDLNRWESALAAPRQQKMAIPLCGTNYRKASKSGPTLLADPPLTRPDPEIPAQTTAFSADTTLESPSTVDTRPPMQPNDQTHARQAAGAADRPTPSSPANNDRQGALAILQKGMESIQALQQQTAQAHQKFLDTQAHASQTLQEMIKSTQRLFVATAEMPLPTPAGLREPQTEPEPIAAPAAAATVNPVPRAAPPPALPTPAAAMAMQPPPTALQAETRPQAVDDLSQTLIAIVSELTGYPQEMLGLEMEIEADLGIDSIKRVEILSAMEARMPHLPRVTPEMMGALRTLGHICDFLADGNPTPDLQVSVAVEAESRAAANEASVHQTLIAIVSELTGYPQEMLGLEMEIEADLGIDSIKRVEILSAMEARMPHLPRVTPEMMGALRTLGHICDFLAGAQTAPADESTAGTPLSTQPAASGPTLETIPRQIVEIVARPKAPGRSIRIASDRWVGVVGGHTALAQSMLNHLQRESITARRLTPDQVGHAASFSGAGGVIICSPIEPETAFLAAKHAASELSAASETGDALLAGITGMDGSFGFSGRPIDDPEQGALAGLIKTAAVEWNRVICRAIDLSPDFSDADAAAGQAVAELIRVEDGDPVEIGLRPDGRVTLVPVRALIGDGPLQLHPTDVVVITGGARGVTAACACALAQASGAAIALIGRSAPPVAVPDWLQAVEEEGAIKRAILQHEPAGSAATPALLESLYRNHLANRTIVRTLDALGALGVQASYFSADVTRPDELSVALNAIRNQMGPITALVHGAGVLHDRLIVDKTIDAFRKVYATKVEGLKNLLSATQTEPLRHLILFSSVSARTGNTGQCDYAMANEALNKMARAESHRRPGCRVTAINWGPWDGGMVTPALKKALHQKNIALIPIETGARLMVAEMKNPGPGPVEVLIGSVHLTSSEAGADESISPLVLLERRELDLHRYPVLASHVIGGKAVVPFALISEWFGHGALKGHPGMALHGLDDFRLLSGIRIEQEKKRVRLLAGKARKNGNAWQVDVELRNGVKNGRDVIHSRARALLVTHFPDAPPFAGEVKNGSRPYPRDLNAVYGPILFHGEHLRAIKTIDHFSDRGMTAHLMGAPEPAAWMQDAIQERWISDPMVLDGAFQMAIVWCFEQTGNVCLPSYARAYRQYRLAFPPSGVKAVMAVSDVNPRRIVADFTFLDHSDQVVATLTGYEATVDEALLHAFQNNGLSPVGREDRP